MSNVKDSINGVKRTVLMILALYGLGRMALDGMGMTNTASFVTVKVTRSIPATTQQQNGTKGTLSKMQHELVPVTHVNTEDQQSSGTLPVTKTPEPSTFPATTTHAVGDNSGDQMIPLTGKNSNNNTSDNTIMEYQNETAISKINMDNPSMWIHVGIWAGEGMFSWGDYLIELFKLAKYYDATFVEPCVLNGVLRSCALLPSNHSLRLRHIFDYTALKKVYPKIVSHEEFVAATGYRPDDERGHIFKPCLQYGGVDCGNVRNTIKKRPQRVIERAGEASKTKLVVLDITHYSRWAISNWQIGKNRVVSRIPEDMSSAMRQVGFPQGEHERIQSMLESTFNFSMGAKFAVIQWRPEGVDDLNYTACAEGILWVRDRISQRAGIPMENFILMSPLSKNRNMMWKGVKNLADEHNDTSYPSLDMLLDAGFKKLEEAFDGEFEDLSLMTVWDFVLAQTATYFSTCTRDACRKGSFCGKCNYRGSSNAHAVSFREEYTGGKGITDKCWPH